MDKQKRIKELQELFISGKIDGFSDLFFMQAIQELIDLMGYAHYMKWKDIEREEIKMRKIRLNRYILEK